MSGLGLDAIDIGRFRMLLERRPHFVARVFSEQEQRDLAQRRDPVPGFAARFAAKEATMKALGVGLGSFAFNEVEVIREQSGAPVLHLSGRAHELAERLGVRTFQVSLTHTALIASAIVFAQ